MGFFFQDNRTTLLGDKIPVDDSKLCRSMVVLRRYGVMALFAGAAVEVVSVGLNIFGINVPAVVDLGAWSLMCGGVYDAFSFEATRKQKLLSNGFTEKDLATKCINKKAKIKEMSPRDMWAAEKMVGRYQSNRARGLAAAGLVLMVPAMAKFISNVTDPSQGIIGGIGVGTVIDSSHHFVTLRRWKKVVAKKWIVEDRVVMPRESIGAKLRAALQEMAKKVGRAIPCPRLPEPQPYQTPCIKHLDM